MKEKKLVVSNESGLHARPAALLVQTVSKYRSLVKILKADFEIDAKSIMGVMTLAAAPGCELKFVAEGEDEEQVLNDIELLFKSKFYE
jgi:phosphocarrier protein